MTALKAGNELPIRATPTTCSDALYFQALTYSFSKGAGHPHPGLTTTGQTATGRRRGFLP